MPGIYRKGKTIATAGLQIIEKTQEEFKQMVTFEDTFYRVKNTTITDGVYIPEKDVVFDFETEDFHINYIDNTDFDYLFSIIHFIKTDETTEGGVKTIEYHLDPNYADAVDYGTTYEPELTSLKFIVTGNLDHTGAVELVCAVIYDGNDYRDSNSFENGDLLQSFPGFNDGEFYYFITNESASYKLYIGNSADNTVIPIDSDLLEYVILEPDPENPDEIHPVIDRIENKIYLGTYYPYDDEFNYYEEWINDHYDNISISGYGSNRDDETRTVTFFPTKRFIDAMWSEIFFSISSTYDPNNIITSIVVTETDPVNFETEWKIYVGGELYCTTAITGENEPVILNRLWENPLYVFSDSSERQDPPMKAYIGNKALNLLLDIPTTDEIEALFKRKGELLERPEEISLVKSESSSHLDQDTDFIIEETAVSTVYLTVTKITEYDIELSVDGYIHDPSTIKTGDDLLCSFILYRNGNINGRLKHTTYGFLTFSDDKYIVPARLVNSYSEHGFYTNWFKLYACIPSDFKNEQYTQQFHGTLRFIVAPDN